jgi:GntR family transcriptional regulator, arabinose operon transcriptional repressor
MTPKKGRRQRPEFKYERVKMDLSLQILEGYLRPHDRIPSLNEIVLKHNVSKITACRVLKDLMAEGLVYTSAGRGSFVADVAQRNAVVSAVLGKRRLGVIFEHASGFFMSDIIMGIDEEAFENNAQIHLALSNNSYDREAENLKRMVQQGIDSILLFMVLKPETNAPNENIPVYLRLQGEGVRLLLLACDLPNVPVPSLTWDDQDGVRRLVQFMAERKCRRIAFVGRVENASTAMARMSGFKDGLLETGLSFDPARMVSVLSPTVETVAASTFRAFTTWLESRPAIDGVVCADEMVASGVFDALEHKRHEFTSMPMVGGICSTPNIHVLKGHPYVMLEQDTHQFGREAAALMLKMENPPGEAGASLRKVLSLPLRIPKQYR